jgi:integrase
VGELFKAYVADRQKDEKLVAAFWHNWKALEPRFGALPAADITDDICRDYAKYRIAAGRVTSKGKQLPISVGTVWSELLRLRSCLNWAAERHLIPYAPHVWIVQKPEPRQRVMTEEEVIRLIDGCGVPHMRLFVILAITTAGRTAAILELTWDRINFDLGVVDLRLKQEINPLTKKARKQRAVVAMTEEARAALLEAKAGAQTNHVVEWDGQRVLKIRKGFVAAVKRGSDVTPHTLRHTVLTWLDEDGIPMERISRLAGHRDINTTRTIYSKPGVDTLKPAADVIDMRLRRKSVAG